MLKEGPNPSAATAPDPRQRLDQFRRQYPPRRIEIDGKVWSTFDLGRGPQALVFLHGLAGGGDIWFQQLLKFAPSYRVVAPTYPPIESIEALADGVWKLLDRLRVERAQVVGSSLGGLLAQRMVAANPERVERVVFSNTFPPGHPEIRRGRWIQRMSHVLPTAVLFAMMKRALRSGQPLLDPGERLMRAYLSEQYEGGMSRAELLSRIACVYGDFEMVPPPMPHAIIESLDEPLLSRTIRSDLKRLYPRAWVYTFKKGGHFPYLAYAGEYNRALTTFLDASYV